MRAGRELIGRATDLGVRSSVTELPARSHPPRQEGACREQATWFMYQLLTEIEERKHDG